MEETSSSGNVLFAPHTRQEEFISDCLSGDYDFILFGGAIRGGKTFALLGFFVLCAFAFPGSKYIVIRETLEVIKSTVLPVFYKLMPKSITVQMPTQSNGWEWISNRGSIIKFFGVDISKDPNLDRLRGLEADSIAFEEMDITKDVFDKAFERVGTWNMKERFDRKNKGLSNPPAMLLGTSNPRKDWVKTDIYDKWREGTLNKRWKYLQSRVYDNPHIDPQFIEDKKANMHPKDFSMFVDGDWDIDKNDEPFFTNYDDNFHFSKGEFEFDPKLQTIISFDFNYNPCTASVYQDNSIGILGMRCYEAKGGTKVLCDLMKKDEELMAVPTYMWLVTGDSSGMSNSSTAGDINDFTIIADEFKIFDHQIRGVHSRNSAHVYSRKLCDYFLLHVPFVMDKRMKTLRDDMLKAKPTKQGALFKDRKKGYAMDHLDNFRYFVDMYFPGGIEDIKKYAIISKNLRA